MKPLVVVSLNGIWNLKNQEGNFKTTVNVPGTVFEALENANLVVDPFYGNNEHDVNFIVNDDWIFERNFQLEKEVLSYDNLFLRFMGLDSITKISLNNSLLGTTDNMFRRYEFDIKDIVQEKNNTLKIYFKSPVQKAKELVEEHKVKLKTTHSMPGLPYIRKAQYSFGWDWGPELPDIGIWKDVAIVGFDEVKIESFYLSMNFTYNKKIESPTNLEKYHCLNINKVDLRIQTQLSGKLSQDLIADLKLKCLIKGPDNIAQEKMYDLTDTTLTVDFDINYPFIWWTHDLGKPNLYELEITLTYKDSEIDSIQTKFGIRDIQLIRNTDKWGETFYFTLNGIPIFAKGANWVPIDSFIPRGKKIGLYKQNIENAIAANMNMIRVWGGGIYEDDLFYELCDKLGILVWQDFPFACAIYPIHEEFIDNVRKEAIQNIKRLRNHPSLALWCGNNELEQLWRWLLFNADLKNPYIIKKYEDGYLKLFKAIIPNLISQYDPCHQYWPSSSLDRYDGSKILSINPNNAESGDSHFWKVWHGGASFKSYRKFDSRFMSEFGFESFPSLKTIKMFCPRDQFYLDSSIMNNHQKNEGGNKKILRYM